MPMTMISNQEQTIQAKFRLKIVKLAHSFRSIEGKINNNKSEATTKSQKRTKPEMNSSFLLTNDGEEHELNYHIIQFNAFKTTIDEEMASTVNEGWPEEDRIEQPASPNTQRARSEATNQQIPAPETSSKATEECDGVNGAGKPQEVVEPDAGSDVDKTTNGVGGATGERTRGGEDGNGVDDNNRGDHDGGDHEEEDESDNLYYSETDDEDDSDDRAVNCNTIVPDPHFMIMDNGGKPQMVEGRVVLDISAASDTHPFVCFNSACRKPFKVYNGIAGHVNGKKCRQVYRQFQIINRGIRRNKEHAPLFPAPTRRRNQSATQKSPRSARTSPVIPTTPPPPRKSPRPGPSREAPVKSPRPGPSREAPMRSPKPGPSREALVKSPRPGPSREVLKNKTKPTPRRKRQRSEDTEDEDEEARVPKKPDNEPLNGPVKIGLDVKLANFEKIFQNLGEKTKRRVEEQIRQYNEKVQNPEIRNVIAKAQADIVEGIEKTMMKFHLMEIYLSCNNGHEELEDNVEEFLADLTAMKKSVEQLDFSAKKF